VGTRIFVGNLAYGTSEAALRTHFEQAGFDVRSARIISDRETGRSRGFGFVELGEDAETQRAIVELDGSDIEGRRVALREAHDRVPGGGGPPREGGPRPYGGGGGRFEGRGPVVERVGSPDARRPPFRGPDRPPFGGDRPSAPFRSGPGWPSAPPVPPAEDNGKGDGRRRKFEDRKAGKKRGRGEDEEDDW
jgi:RNA recognition motif-containing protein